MANSVETITDGYGRTVISVDDDGLIEFPTVGIALTPCGGFARAFTNKTGARTVRGQLVTTGSAANSVINTSAGVPNAIGAIWTVGADDGTACYVVISGVADILFADGQAPTVGYWVGSSDAVDGRARAAASLPDNSGAGVTMHNHEIGHCIQTVAAGTDVVARAVLHFN